MGADTDTHTHAQIHSVMTSEGSWLSVKKYRRLSMLI
jgi:hypothetical protein